MRPTLRANARISWTGFWEATSVVDPALRQDILAETWLFLQEEHYEWTTGITHSLYGVSPRIQAWEPWPLVAYLTGVWTIQIKD